MNELKDVWKNLSNLMILEMVNHPISFIRNLSNSEIDKFIVAFSDIYSFFKEIYGFITKIIPEKNCWYPLFEEIVALFYETKYALNKMHERKIECELGSIIQTHLFSRIGRILNSWNKGNIKLLSN